MHDIASQPNTGPGSSVEVITDGPDVVAIIVRSTFVEPGVHFFSPSDFSQQLGAINYPAGHTIEPHVHKPVTREVIRTQETLVIRSGKCRLNLYREDRSPLTTREMYAGDIILLAAGGHGFDILEDCMMFEVKQGPYAGDMDKERFEADAG